MYFIIIILMIDWDQSPLTANVSTFVLSLAVPLEAVFSGAVVWSGVVPAVVIAAPPASEGFLLTTVPTHQKGGKFVESCPQVTTQSCLFWVVGRERNYSFSNVFAGLNL